MDAWRQVLDRQQGVATRAQLRAAGLTRWSLDRELRADRLRRIGPGLYRDRPCPARGVHLLTGGRCDPGFVAEVRTALLRLPGACASGRTAAVLWGFDMVVEPDRIEAHVPHGRRPPALVGVSTRQVRDLRSVLLAPIVGCAPVPVTHAVDTVLECAAQLPLAQAVAIADSALRLGACTRTQLREKISARRGWEFCDRVWRVLRWCDPRCGSVLESLLRVLLCEAGLRPPRTQYRVSDASGMAVGRVDFAWPDQRLVVEADGRRWHDPQDVRDADRRRDNGCARLGWRVLRVTWADVVHAPAEVVIAVRQALDAEAVRPGLGRQH